MAPSKSKAVLLFTCVLFSSSVVCTVVQGHQHAGEGLKDPVRMKDTLRDLTTRMLDITSHSTAVEAELKHLNWVGHSDGSLLGLTTTYSTKKRKVKCNKSEIYNIKTEPVSRDTHCAALYARKAQQVRLKAIAGSVRSLSLSLHQDVYLVNSLLMDLAQRVHTMPNTVARVGEIEHVVDKRVSKLGRSVYLRPMTLGWMQGGRSTYHGSRHGEADDTDDISGGHVTTGQITTKARNTARGNSLPEPAPTKLPAPDQSSKEYELKPLPLKIIALNNINPQGSIQTAKPTLPQTLRPSDSAVHEKSVCDRPPNLMRSLEDAIGLSPDQHWLLDCHTEACCLLTPESVGIASILLLSMLVTCLCGPLVMTYIRRGQFVDFRASFPKKTPTISSRSISGLVGPSPFLTCESSGGLCVIVISAAISTHIRVLRLMAHIATANEGFQGAPPATISYAHIGVESTGSNNPATAISKAKLVMIFFECQEPLESAMNGLQIELGREFINTSIGDLYKTIGDVVLILVGDTGSSRLPKGTICRRAVADRLTSATMRALWRAGRIFSINRNFTATQERMLQDWLRGALNKNGKQTEE